MTQTGRAPLAAAEAAVAGAAPIVAARRTPRGVGTRRSWIVTTTVGVAVLLHLAVATMFFVPLPRLLQPAPPPAGPVKQATIEVVQQDTPTVGNSKPAPRTADPTPTPPRQDTDKTPAPPQAPPAPPQQAAAPPVPQAANGELAHADRGDDPAARQDRSAPPAPPTAPAAAAAPAAIAAPPDVRLAAEGDGAGTGLIRGDNIVPAGPDSLIHNPPPVYPRAAARNGEQGTVDILVRVGPDGAPMGLEVAHSSGSTSLDDAAITAVRKWRFKPAQQGGLPIASTFPMRFEFDLNKR